MLFRSLQGLKKTLQEKKNKTTPTRFEKNLAGEKKIKQHQQGLKKTLQEKKNKTTPTWFEKNLAGEKK